MIEYDSGKASNVLSLLAFVLAVASLWRGERQRAFQEYPDIDARQMPESEGIIPVRLAISNNSPISLQLERIDMVSPRSALIVGSGEFARSFWQDQPTAGLDRVPVRSRSFTDQLMAPKGDNQDTALIRMLISYVGQRPEILRFNVVCIARPTDQRRRRRIVSKQMLKLATVKAQVVQGDRSTSQPISHQLI